MMAFSCPPTPLRAGGRANDPPVARAGIRERYGMDPQIRFFETACITDNASEAVLLPDATRY